MSEPVGEWDKRMIVLLEMAERFERDGTKGHAEFCRELVEGISLLRGQVVELNNALDSRIETAHNVTDVKVLSRRLREMKSSTSAFRSPSPQPEAESGGHPDTVRLDFLIRREATITLDGRVPTYVVYWCGEDGEVEEERHEDPRKAIDSAREAESDE